MNHSNFTAQHVLDYLKARYPHSEQKTGYLFLSINKLDKEIALETKKLSTPTVRIFISDQPPEDIIEESLYKFSPSNTTGKSPNSNLNTNTKTLRSEDDFYIIYPNSLEQMQKLCDWYDEKSKRTTNLERRVKAFLEQWPVERLKNLTVEDYHQANSKDCFIAQIDSFDPTQGKPTFANYFDIWEPVTLGKDDKYQNEKPYSWNKRLGNTPAEAFQNLKQEILDIVDAVQRRDLNAIDQIQFTKGLKWMIAFLYQDFSKPCVIPIVGETNIKRIGYDSYVKTPIPEFLPILLADQGDQEFFPYVEKLFAMIRKGYLDYKQKKQQTKELVDEVMMQQPLNRILFGAAGTGKTYHTINHALSVIENKTLNILEKEDRTELKARFDEYKDLGRIEFVTFHQSFSYEDFVEGIRAETDDQGKLNYNVEPGVFKIVCERAKENKKVMQDLGVRPNAVVWKLSMGDLSTRQYCFEHGQMRVGWGQTGNLLDEKTKYSEGYKQFSSTDHHTLEQFVSGVEIGDVVLCLKSTNEICGVAVVTDDYFFDENHPEAVREDYLHCRNVNWILKDITFNIRSLNGGVGLTLKTMYRLWRFTWTDLLQELNKAGYLLDKGKDAKQDPYVLIIDEINRGNISRIFGELITLIEDSKRQDADEALSVILPYSKKEFSVPDNVYIIGTMNSSDRSLTGLDIALRRRFTFIEMPPKPELLNEVFVDGVNIGRLLNVINQRIEVLLDRDHCIGHANFMSLKKQPTLEHLTSIFKQKIIPQLQEYFFDDWSRINMVLNANGMLQPKAIVRSTLFPNVNAESDSFIEEQQTWELVESAFDSIESFAMIIKH